MKDLSVVETAIQATCSKKLKKLMQDDPWFVFKNANYGEIYKSLEFAGEIPGGINRLEHAVTYNNKFYKRLKELVFDRLFPVYVAEMTEKLILSYSSKSSKNLIS